MSNTTNNTTENKNLELENGEVMNEEIRDIILRNGSVAEMHAAAVRNGMTPLREAGMQKIFEGTTTIEEVVRETVLDY